MFVFALACRPEPADPPPSHPAPVPEPAPTTTPPPEPTTTTPPPPPPPPATLEVATGEPTALGTTGFSVNGEVHPHGIGGTTYWFEYGPTDAYGMSTPI